ncbi:MAG: CBS domain-containing protein [Desulfuromonadales bacterium]
MKQTIGKYATRSVVAVEVETRVQEALQLMSERGISSVIVLSHDEPIGILTERDVVFAANWLLGQPDLLIKEVMNKPIMTVSGELTLAQGYRIFRQYDLRHLVVLDGRLEMTGIFTQTDLVHALREKAFDGIKDVAQLMTKQVLHVTPDVPARYALSQMARRSVSCIVVAENRRPLGIFSERDVVRNIAKGKNLSSVPVASVMNPTIISLPLTTSPYASAKLMLKKSIKRIVIVDEQGNMTGILTHSDISRALDHQEERVVNRMLEDTASMPGVLQQ